MGRRMPMPHISRDYSYLRGGFPYAQTYPELWINEVTTYPRGSVVDFLMSDRGIFPDALLWVSGQVLSNSSFKVVEIKGMLDKNMRLLQDRDGGLHLLKCTRTMVVPEYSVLVPTVDVPDEAFMTVVEVAGVAMSMFYDKGVNFGKLEPVLIPPAPNWDGNRMPWPEAIYRVKSKDDFRLVRGMEDWAVASWEKTVKRWPHMALRVPHDLAERMGGVVGDTAASGILD